MSMHNQHSITEGLITQQTPKTKSRNSVMNMFKRKDNSSVVQEGSTVSSALHDTPVTTPQRLFMEGYLSKMGEKGQVLMERDKKCYSVYLLKHRYYCCIALFRVRTPIFLMFFCSIILLNHKDDVLQTRLESQIFRAEGISQNLQYSYIISAMPLPLPFVSVFAPLYHILAHLSRSFSPLIPLSHTFTQFPRARICFTTRAERILKQTLRRASRIDPQECLATCSRRSQRRITLLSSSS